MNTNNVISIYKKLNAFIEDKSLHKEINIIIIIKYYIYKKI